MSDVVIGALTLQLKADDSQLRMMLERYRALGAQGVNVKITTDTGTAQAGLKGMADAATQAGAAGKAAGAAIGQGNAEATQTAANYAKTISLNMQLEAQRASEYRAGLQLNSRLAADATRQQSALESEAAKNYRATMSLNLGLAGQRAAAEKAAAAVSTSAAQQSAQAFTAGAERTKQALDGIRLAMAQARATFDKQDGEAQGWRQNRDAALAYQRSVQGVTASLQGLKASGEATVQQLKQIADMEARLAREQNTLAGGINRLGISGNFQNAIGGAQQLSMFMPGLIGQSLGAASAFQQIASSSGVMGVALGVAGLAVFAIGKQFLDAAQAFGSFQQGLQGISSIDTSLSGRDMQDIAGAIQELSVKLPITTEQLTNMARGAVQMGITGKDSIMEFTNSIALLSVATRENNKTLGDTGQLSLELGKFLNETGSTARTYTTDLKGVVSTLAAVDKVTPGTIQSTLSLARYMASGSVVLGLNKNAIIGLSGALSGLGLNAESGGSSVIRVLIAMNRAAGASEDKLGALSGVAGITQDDLANIFQGQITSRAAAFAQVMGVTTEQFRDLIKNNPSQAYQLLADGIAKARASGVNMAAILDELGLKNIRDVRLVDALTVGHENLKIALDASSDSTKNQADLQDRVQKATQNSVDKTTELKNAWTAAAQSFGEAATPSYNILLDFLARSARGAKDFADSLHGLSEETKSYLSLSGLSGQVGGKDLERVAYLTDQIAKFRAGMAQQAPDVQAQWNKQLLKDLKELEQIRQRTVSQPGGSGFVGPLTPEQQKRAGTPSRGFTQDKGTAIQKAAAELGINPNDLAAIISFETGGTFDQAIKNPKSSATGLIQFMEQTAKDMGTTTAALKAMSFQDQMKYVVEYLKGRGIKSGASLGDVYSAVTGSGYKRGSAAYEQNRVWDANKDGVIDRGEAVKSPQFQAHMADYFPGAGSYSGTSGGTSQDEATLRATGQKLYDTYQGGDHSTSVIKAMNAFKKAHKELWQSIAADAKKGKDDLTPITAEQILQAQRLEAALKKAQERLKANPASVEATKAVDTANSAIKRFTDGSFSNARAFQSVSGANSTQASGSYNATLSDLKKYGDDALKLIKAQEAAQKSGDDARIASSDAALAAFTKDSKARGSVVQVEAKAYQARQQQRSEGETAEQKALADSVQFATGVQQAAEKAEAKRLQALKESQGITQALRAQDVGKAEGHLEALKRLRDDDLKSAGDNVAAQLAVQKQYAAGIRAGAEAIANAQFKIDKKAADSGPAQLRDGAVIIAKQKRDAALAAARSTEPVDTATQKQTDAVVKQRDAYSKLADSIRQQTDAGTFDAQAQHDALVTFNALGRETDKLGLSNDKYVKGARVATFALTEQGHAAFLTAARLSGMVSGNDEAADSAVQLASDLQGLGDEQGGLEVLQQTYDSLTASLTNSEASAASVDKVRLALEALQNSLGTQSDVNDWLSNLDGSIDDQLQAITDKLSDPNTTMPFKKALQAATQGFGEGAVTPGPMGEAGTQAVADQGFMAQFFTAQDFTNRIATDTGTELLQTMKEAAAFLASVIGQTLPPEVKAALQLGIDGATAGMKALADVLAHPDDYRDGARGLATPPESPDAILARQKKEQDARRQVQDAQDALSGTMLDAYHSQGLMQEQSYLDARMKLDVTAAHRKASLSLEEGKDYRAIETQLSADLLAIQTKYGTDSVQARQAMKDKLYGSKSGELQMARAELDSLHTFQLVSDRAFQARREQQDRDAADASFAAGKSSFEEYQAELTRINRQGVMDRAALDKAGMDSFIQGIESLGSALGGMTTAAGAALTTLGGVAKLSMSIGAKGGLLDQTKGAFGAGGSIFDKLGAVGGWAGAIATGISLLGQLGDAIMNMDPKLQANKKMWLELADAEKAAMGSKSYGGNSIINPYYKALEKDSAALTTKANAGFWQRVGWSIFGGAPETLGKAQAEALTKAGTIFNDFAGTLYGSMESALMNAFDSGDFSGVEKAIEKSLNNLVAKMYLQTLIAKSKIGDDLKMLADDQAAGKDITADLARLRGDTNSVSQQFQAGSAALPGFGAGAVGSTPGSSGPPASVIGAGPSAVYGVPEIKFPEIMLASFTSFNAAIPTFAAGSQRMLDAANLIVQTMGPQMVRRSGTQGLV